MYIIVFQFCYVDDGHTKGRYEKCNYIAWSGHSVWYEWTKYPGYHNRELYFVSILLALNYIMVSILLDLNYIVVALPH